MKRRFLIAATICCATTILIGLIYFASALSQAGAQQSVPASPSRPPPPFAGFGPDCAIAPVDPETTFVAAGVYEGDTLANVQIDDAQSVATIVRVYVPSGRKQITVLLQASSQVIWDFEGAVDRVARAMIVAYRDRGAVRGISRERAEFLKLTRCPVDASQLENRLRGRDGGRHSETLKAQFGLMPEKSGYLYAANSITLPELQFGSSPKEGPERNTSTDAESSLLQYHPGGFRTLDPKSLYSPSRILVPETYPGEAGLIQLERAGAIRRARSEESAAFREGFGKQFRSRLSPDFRMGPGFDYVVLRDVTLPAGLHGAHSKNFLIPAGVPSPRGSPGHGCIGYEDGFRINDDGATCLGSEGGAAIRRLRELSKEIEIACRLIDVREEVSVQAVSIYEPKGAKHSSNSQRVPTPVDIKVNQPGAVLLALNSYEPALWRISTREGTRIAGVVLTGYYSSSVEGVAPDTPVVQLNLETRKTQPPANPACAPLYGYLGVASRGGPAAILFDRQISAVTGKSIDTLRGEYALGSIDIQ